MEAAAIDQRRKYSLDVFDLRERLVRDYRAYTRSFIKIRDPEIEAFVDGHLAGEGFWPEPLLQLNPNFAPGGTIDDLVDEGALHEECAQIFRLEKSENNHHGKQLQLHRHQREAILKASEGRSYVLTTGTGSGKSLAYIVPIVDRVLRTGSGNGIQAIIVYPMNALANSQEEELAKFLHHGYPEGQPPVRFARFTGQEKGETRERTRGEPPDILLTNYMMLELMLTRWEDRELVRAAKGLKFLVFDEIHTYRGRQGADVAMLIRRCRHAFEGSDGGTNMLCIGTSATMASDGTSEQQREAVASVSQTLFGVEISPQQVIGETLERATPEDDKSNGTTRTLVQDAIRSGAKPPADYETFHRHPLASWIESTFGIRKESITGQLVRQTPRRLTGDPLGGEVSAANELADFAEAEPDQCAHALREWLKQGTYLYRTESSRFPIFAFRLHQFLTRGDTVWSTLEPESHRHLEINKKAAKPGEPDKPLYPLVFCRQCGTAYYRVARIRENGEDLHLSREDRRDALPEDSEAGYLYMSEAEPWPDAADPTYLDRVPAAFKEKTPKGREQVRRNFRKYLPISIFIAPTGHEVPEGQGAPAAFIHEYFRFCLAPECGVAYTGAQRSERFKLSTLGVDNRSTATTILAVRSLIELQHDRELTPEARKLLSFTDNRQDASLQAGHFNDFVQVALLRSALYHACSQRPEGLRHGDLSRCVHEAMNPDFADYAADPDIRGPARQATRDAFRRVLEYFLYRDLERGWRVTAPNLEDCALLRFEYEGLTGEDGLLSETRLWEAGFEVDQGRGRKRFVEAPAALRQLPSAAREEVLRTLLDWLRRSKAIKVDALDPRKQHDLVEQTKPRLLEGTVWYLDDERELTNSGVAWPRPRPPKRRNRDDVFISPRSAYGRYMKQVVETHSPNRPALAQSDLQEIILFLFFALKRYGIVEQVRSRMGRGARSRTEQNGDETPGFQLNPDALRWLSGDGRSRPADRMRLLEEGGLPAEVNRYFVECYKRFADLHCRFEAREHTAQVTPEERQEREERFREGSLPLLFCSPTMELGVDIAQLNLVNLRNVPPTPANYAQRSGRAGRGGQPALVFTYCAGRSPHDQYFYRQPASMVAGSVSPPRIDLRNRDLIRSHIHAIWMGAATPDLGKTLAEVLDLESSDRALSLPVKSALQDELRNPVHRAAAQRRADAVIREIRSELGSARWFHEDWVEDTLKQIERSFDSTCDRWRSLYRAAVRQRERHHSIILDLSRPQADRAHSTRLRGQAERQIKLLTEPAGIFQGDFYSYRYFATEGFLPGYNFPRLPISAYVPGRRRRKDHSEFINRPRFLAISEFGPRALVYHEGARYRVNQVNLDFGSASLEDSHQLDTDTMKRCSRCGYCHLEAGDTNLAEVCDRCGASLDPPCRIDSLVRMQNVNLRLAQRITCDEEERQRFGYDLVTAYRFPEVSGKLDRQDAEAHSGGTLVVRLHYGDATDLYRINQGWLHQRGKQSRGFLLDLERGYWSSNQADASDREDATSDRRTQRVVPYVKDTKNALIIRFEPARSNDETASLQAAFKQAIQQHFQIEPRELSCEALPSRDDRRELLFYEASEGGAGVLRQLVDSAEALPALARRALKICHYDPGTLEDRAGDQCGRACYECLLDYGNQPDHLYLDRELIRDFLAELARCECRPAGGAGTRAERLAALRRRCDSRLEERWLDRVDSLGLRLPSDAQYRIPQVATRPDFYYHESNAAIYIDGPPHDAPDQIREDDGITTALNEFGYIVIRFHHASDWLGVFRRHPDVFGVPTA